MLLKNDQIHIRDPFILPVAEEGKYYLYGSHGPASSGPADRFVVYSSISLDEWEGPFTAFQSPSGFWADRDFWAPEVHRLRNAYYMFATFSGEKLNRGSQILRAESPLGPFLPISDGPMTPREWMCLDATLFVDESGSPWTVFCHEWTQVGNGEICAMPLSEDLSQSISDPITLFRAHDAPWVTPVSEDNYVTDGPFIYRLSNGKLLMLWSSFTNGGYAQGIAESVSGNILGPWIQQDKPLYTSDSGHGMLFHDFSGSLFLVLYSPNKRPLERPLFIPVQETAEGISIPG